MNEKEFSAFLLKKVVTEFFEFYSSIEPLAKDKLPDYISEEEHQECMYAREYLLPADKNVLKELGEHLSMNGYTFTLDDNLLYADESEHHEVETILEDRNICFVSRGPVRQLDITQMDIRCCDLYIEDDSINIQYELWFDVDKYFGWQTEDIDGVWINFYTDWHPDGNITASYSVDGELYFHEVWSLTTEEIEFFKNKMEEYCQESYGQSLAEFWKEQVPDYGHCNTCRHYSKCNICSNCNEGSQYEYYVELKK